ncbi:hypothetical protein [Fretibacter rubidus]|uniref:hypothetical protein n=1 Tax=Fretibacter rubidus TaxID=570162 RepID=UPI00352A3680
MSKRHRKTKDMMSVTSDDGETIFDHTHFEAPRGKKPRGKEKRQSTKRAYYDD